MQSLSYTPAFLRFLNYNYYTYRVSFFNLTNFRRSMRMEVYFARKLNSERYLESTPSRVWTLEALTR